MKQHEDISWIFFGNKTIKQIGWLCRKIDGVWSLSLRNFKQLTDGGVLSSHQNYVDSYSGDKQKEAMWIHHFVILQLFHAKFKKVEIINFVHDTHSLFVCHFNHDKEKKYTNIFEDMLFFEFLRLGERIKFVYI